MIRRAPVALFAVALIACQATSVGGTPDARSAIPADVGVGPRSTFAIATLAGLLGLDAQGRALGRIVALPRGATPSSPVLHPTGNPIYFALSQTAEGIGFGADIYRVSVDGTDLRPVVTRDKPNVFYASPAVDPTGQYLYVHRRAAKDEPNAPYLQTEDTIERVDLRTGARQRVLEDAAEPAIVPSTNRLVYVHLDRGQQAGLYTASANGDDASPFLKTGDRFWFLQAPRVSPSGREITFSSAGRMRSLQFPRPSSGTGPRLAHLDIPSELYVAAIDGTSLRSVASTLDDVVPAWSPDSATIAYVALGIFYVVSASDGTVISRASASGFLYGDPVWLRA